MRAPAIGVECAGAQRGVMDSSDMPEGIQLNHEEHEEHEENIFSFVVRMVSVVGRFFFRR